MNVTIDEDGNKVYEEDMMDIEKKPAGTIILAIGQGPQVAVIPNTTVERNDNGVVSVDASGHTNRRGGFAVGDIVSGPRTVVEVVAFTKKWQKKLFRIVQIV